MSNIVTPHAAVIIWNYKDRGSAEGLHSKNVNAVERKIISTLSILSIETGKEKSKAAGTCRIRLAPTRNWVTTITPGSWMTVLMTRNPITQHDLKEHAHAHQIKFLGRIESVRASVEVDQTTGARKTEFLMTCKDWGCIFNSKVYIDRILANSGEEYYSALLMEQLIKSHSHYASANGVPSVAANFKLLIKLWAMSNGVTEDIQKETNILMRGRSGFKMPNEMINYFRFKRPNRSERLFEGKKQHNDNIESVIDLINLQAGVVKRDKTKKHKVRTEHGVIYDKYKPIVDGVGLITPDKIWGIHEIWQLLHDNSNNVINELLCDLRWRHDGSPQLALYRRIKPFVINSLKSDKKDKTIFKSLFGVRGRRKAPYDFKDAIHGAASTAAHFSDLRTVLIELQDIISINAGTNWRDKYNFIEIMLDLTLVEKDIQTAALKEIAQTFDANSFEREGFKPLIQSTRYAPPLIQGKGKKDKPSEKENKLNNITLTKKGAETLDKLKKKQEAEDQDKKAEDKKAAEEQAKKAAEEKKKDLPKDPGKAPNICEEEEEEKTVRIRRPAIPQHAILPGDLPPNSPYRVTPAPGTPPAEAKPNNKQPKENEAKNCTVVPEPIDTTKKSQLDSEGKEATPASKGTTNPEKTKKDQAKKDSDILAKIKKETKKLIGKSLFMHIQRIWEWKFLLRHWYFNTHLLLNGSVSFIGQDNYIQIGDNIMFDAQALGQTLNWNKDMIKHRDKGRSVYILAHVESVANKFTVDADGRRKFVSTVNFVRGAIVDRDRRMIDEDMRINRKAKDVSQQDEKLKNVLISSSTVNPNQSDE